MKSWLYMAGVVVVLVLGIAAVKAYSVSQMIRQAKAQGVPKYTVSAARAEKQAWQPSLSAVATIHAVHGADLSPEVAGIVESIEFESGQDVKAGQLLARLRADDDIAHLQSLQVTAALDQVVYARDREQFAAEAVSQATLDTDQANLRAAQAQVDEQRAVLAKKSIRAPFAGRVGIRAVDPGQYVATGTKIVTLQTLDPIYVDFSLPQQDLPALAVGQAVRVFTAAAPGSTHTGRIEAINPQVDAATRNVQVRAKLRNEDLKLLPGMYVDVTIDTGESEPHLTLPQTALVYNAYGTSVFVIRPPGEGGSGSLSVRQQFVETGPTRGDQVAVLKGLAEGDQVVTSGQLKLKSGALVVVDNSVVPANDASPHPSNE